MYAESVILEKLHKAAILVGHDIEYHSVDEVQKWNDHLSSPDLIEVNGEYLSLKRELNEKEVRWIRNERALCHCDAMYFKTRYCYISNEENRLVRYVPRQSQIVFNRILQDLDERQISIEIMALKARQLGISTEVELNFTHRVIFTPGAKAVAASADALKSELMAGMFYTAIDNLPWWLRPQFKKNRRSGNRGMIEFFTNSIVSIQTGAQETGIAQGWTPTLAHISEVALYNNPVALIEEGLFRAMHSSPSLFLVLESTGEGNTGWWADTWRSSKEFYSQGRARLMPLFLPWHTATDLYPKKDWLDKYPIPTDWTPARETIAHANKCKAYVRSTEVLRRQLGSDWELPRNQMWFWEFNYKEHERKGQAKSWTRMMPCDDYEALLGSNDSVFGHETIIEVQNERTKEVQVYGFVGDGIDEEHEPAIADIDYEKERVPVSWTTPRGEVLEWVLIPLKPISETDEASAMTKLLVWEAPIPGCTYSIGGDTAEGVGGDRSVGAVDRNGSDDLPDIQAAEFCSDVVSTAQMSSFLACIGAWYASAMPNGVPPKFVIEQRRKPGDDCQLQLKRMGFYRHHRFIYYDGVKIDEKNSNKEGWYTMAWSRPMLLGKFVDAVKNGWFKINSPFLIKECESFEQRHTGSGAARWDHQSGKHDDRIFGNAMAYFTAHHLDAMIERSKKRYNPSRNKKLSVDMSTYHGASFSVSTPSERL